MFVHTYIRQSELAGSCEVQVPAVPTMNSIFTWEDITVQYGRCFARFALTIILADNLENDGDTF